MWTRYTAFFNRGFFYGPWLPVYGIGAVFLYLILSPLRKKPLAVFFLSGVLGSLTELIIGLTLDTYWDMRYWDYSDQLLAIGSYVCLYSFLGFCLAGCLWVCFAVPRLRKLFFRFPRKIRTLLVTVLCLFFLADLCFALLRPNQGEGITFSFSLVSYTFGL